MEELPQLPAQDQLLNVASWLSTDALRALGSTSVGLNEFVNNPDTIAYISRANNIAEPYGTLDTYSTYYDMKYNPVNSGYQYETIIDYIITNDDVVAYRNFVNELSKLSAYARNIHHGTTLEIHLTADDAEEVLLDYIFKYRPVRLMEEVRDTYWDTLFYCGTEKLNMREYEDKYPIEQDHVRNIIIYGGHIKDALKLRGNLSEISVVYSIVYSILSDEELLEYFDMHQISREENILDAISRGRPWLVVSYMLANPNTASNVYSASLTPEILQAAFILGYIGDVGLRETHFASTAFRNGVLTPDILDILERYAPNYYATIDQYDPTKEESTDEESTDEESTDEDEYGYEYGDGDDM